MVISRVSYEYKKPKRSDVREQNHLYNDDGSLAQLTTIYGFGKTMHETYTYNDQAQLITRNIVVNGADTSTIHYEYNSDGTIAKLTEHYPNETQDNRFYRYSESGLLIHSSFTVNGQEVENYTYHYDELGNKVLTEKKSKMGIIGTNIDKTHHSYDSLNHLIKSISHGRLEVAGVMQSVQKSERNYIYEDNGQLSREEHYYQSWQEGDKRPSYSFSSHIHYIQDSDGLLTEERHMTVANDGKSELVKTVKYRYTMLRALP